MMVFASFSLSLFTFLAISSLGRSDEPSKVDIQKRLLQDQFVEKLLASYRSALVGFSNGSILLNGSLPNNDQCANDLANIKKDGAKLFKYFDTAGKPRSGISRGNLLWLGSYSECLALSDAKYCLSTMELDYPPLKIAIKPIYWGACFPRSCNAANISSLMNKILPKIETATGIYIKYIGPLCPEGPTYTTGVKAAIAFFGILLFFCLLGTIIDLVCEERKEVLSARERQQSGDGLVEHVQLPPCEDNQYPQSQSVGNIPGTSSDMHPLLVSNPTFTCPRIFGILFEIFFIVLGFMKDFLLCFSLVRNSQKIFNTDVPPVAITSINGIRVISILWVMLGHMFLLFIFSPFTDNKAGLIEDSQLLSIMPVINGYYSVDSFFFLSGLLVAYTCFRKLEKSGGIFKFNWILFYVHRYLRLTPTLMAVVLISVELKRFLASGPIWYQQYEDKLCEDYWWTNLLYINNFHPKTLGDECVGVSWYLANDMQFFVITPPLLILMYKFGWAGLIGPGTLLSASTIATAFIYGNWDLDPFSSLRIGQTTKTPEQTKRSNEYQQYVYTKPWCRAQPYLVGFILGYFIYRYSIRQSLNIRRRYFVFWSITIVGWAIAAGLGMWLVYGPHKFIKNGAEEWPLAGRVAYGATERLLWALVLAWVTYACHFGGGGIVKKFLSSKFWIPFSRLTFNVYLIHIYVITVMMIGSQGYIHYDSFTISYYFAAAIMLSYAAAYMLAVTLELPLDNLENLVIKRLRGRRI